MNKSYIVHLKNKYPSGQVHSSETSIDVFQGGQHRVALRKNGNGDWVDASAELGCSDKFSLEPLPKEARVHKLHKDGKIGLDEEHAARKPQAEKIAAANGGRVPSSNELAEAAKKAADSSSPSDSA